MRRRPSNPRKDSPMWLVIDEWYALLKPNDFISPSCELFEKENDARKFAEQEEREGGRAQWLFELNEIRESGVGRWGGKP